jgi:NAD+ synthase
MTLSNDIIKWLKDYNKESKTKCFVVGISGGIDSATVSTLCAMTGIETHVVSLPILQNSTQLKLANNHINWLKLNFKNVIFHEKDLTDIFLKFKETFNNFNDDLSYANSRSRLRMVSLYQISGYNKGIVVGTGNKIEDFGVGFFTKYGDGGVDISPIADLTKTEVKNLAKSLGVIPEILNAKPTDGLWDDDRNDEDQIGATYSELEWAMSYLESKDQDFLTERQKEVLEIYTNLNNKNKHKMLNIPIFYRK